MQQFTRVVMTTPVAEEEALTWTLTCTSGLFTLSGTNRLLSLDKVKGILQQNKQEGTLHFQDDGSATMLCGKQTVIIPQPTMQVLQATFNVAVGA